MDRKRSLGRSKVGGVGGKKKKKLVIKPFKVAPRLPANFQSEAMGTLEAAVRAVHQTQPLAESTETLYSNVESLCNHNHAMQLFQMLSRLCEEHITHALADAAQVLEQALAASASSPSLSNSSSSLISSSGDPSVGDAAALRVLPTMVQTWGDHMTQMYALRSMFLYLDRTYVIQLHDTRTIWDLGLRLFSEAFAGQPQLVSAVVSGMVALTNKDRAGEAVDKAALSSLSNMMSSLRLYASAFEPAYLEASREFFERESKAQLTGLGVADYMRHVALRVQQEEQRVDNCLHATSLGKIRAITQTTMIAEHADTILAEGFSELLKSEAKEELTLLFELLARVDMLAKLNNAWSEFIQREGETLVVDPSKDSVMVQRLLDFRGKMQRVLSSCFQDAEKFRDAMKDAFEVFINKRSNRPAELIAKFLDKQLKKKGSGLTDDELSRVLDGVMELFRYVYGKDVFQEYYKKDLAKRLLLKKSASIAAERDMVGRIKSECGATYTTKLEGMFKDMELSKQLRTEFNLQRDSKSSSSSSIISSSADFQMDVDVLAAGNWPEYQPSQATLPSQVTAMQEEFATFYVNKHQSRKLTFQPELSTCILTARFPKGKKELQVSAYQAAILHLFNESDTRTFKMIRDGSGIPLAHANVTLQSLCVMKKGEVPLLFRKSKSKGPLKDEEEFCLNMNYKNKLFRVTINTIQLRETKKEHKNTDERIEKNRRIAIMCAVVRVMKSRKQLSHQDLLAEVFPQLNFTTKARDVKMRIEDLIEREYLERDESDRNLYNYKA